MVNNDDINYSSDVYELENIADSFGDWMQNIICILLSKITLCTL